MLFQFQTTYLSTYSIQVHNIFCNLESFLIHILCHLQARNHRQTTPTMKRLQINKNIMKNIFNLIIRLKRIWYQISNIQHKTYSSRMYIHIIYIVYYIIQNNKYEIRHNYYRDSPGTQSERPLCPQMILYACTLHWAKYCVTAGCMDHSEFTTHYYHVASINVWTGLIRILTWISK